MLSGVYNKMLSHMLLSQAVALAIVDGIARFWCWSIGSKDSGQIETSLPIILLMHLTTFSESWLVPSTHRMKLPDFPLCASVQPKPAARKPRGPKPAPPKAVTAAAEKKAAIAAVPASAFVPKQQADAAPSEPLSLAARLAGGLGV